MQLSVKGKQIDIGDALRGHIEENLPPIVTKYFENPIESHVTMMREGRGFKADISVSVAVRSCWGVLMPSITIHSDWFKRGES